MNGKPLRSTIYLRGLPRDLKDMFKAYCARRGKTMTKTVIDFMRQSVEHDRKFISSSFKEE